MKRLSVRNILTLFALAGCFFMSGFFYEYHLPRIESWILFEVEKQSKKHSPLRLWPQQIELHLFPTGITLKNTRVLPQKKLAKSLAPFSIKKIQATLDYIGLLKGQLRLGELIVDGTTVSYFEKGSALKEVQKKAKPAIKLPFKIKDLARIPIQKIVLKNTNIQSKITYQNISTRIDNLYLSITNNPKGLIFDLNSPKVMIKQSNHEKIFKSSIKTKFLIEKAGVYVTQFKLERDSSYILGAGRVLGNIENFNFKDIKGKLRAQIVLNEAYKTAIKLFPNLQIPSLSGTLYSDIDLKYLFDNNPTVNMSFKTKKLKVDGYVIDNIDFKSDIKNHLFNFKSLSVKNSAGFIQLKDTKVNTKKNITFATTIKANHLNLRQLLKNIKVGDIPVHLPLKGELPCTGSVKPKLEVKCKGQIDADALAVNDGSKEPFEIVRLGKFSANGNVTITDKEVTYNAKLAVSDNTGSSNGVIDYNKGFKINYETDELNLTNIKNLANLKFEGLAKIKGSTQGDSKAATIDMNLQTKDFWLEDYGIGNLNTKLTYKSGTLHFKESKGNFKTSRFHGNLAINLIDSKIRANLTAPFLDADDILNSLSRKTKLNIPVNGTGSARIKLNGPLDFTRLSYDLKSSLYRGTIANERFDRVQFNVSSKNGLVKTKNVKILKERGHIDLTGSIQPTGNMKLAVKGKDLRIEDYDNLKKFNLNISGDSQFNMKLSGHILNPDIDVNGTFNKVVIGDTPAEDSQFDLSINTRRIKANANFIGGVVNTNFSFPIVENEPFNFYLKTNKWNFANFFNIFSEALESGEYQTSVTSEISLNSPSGRVLESNGKIVVDDFFIKRGPISMQSLNKMQITIKDEKVFTKNCIIQGEGSFLKLTSNRSSQKTLNLNLDGKLNMSLLTLFTPFLNELRGTLSLSLNLGNTLRKPQLVGSSYLEDVYLKFKDFPHPLENMRADLLFNQKTMLVNSIKGQIAGGNVTGSGKVTLNGPKDVLVNLNANVFEGSFKVPNGFQTKASGDLFFKGNWFPYILGGNFNVTSGRVNLDLNSAKKSQKQIQPSEFLPKFLIEQDYNPIELDLKVNIENPLPVDFSMTGIQVNTPITGNMHIKGDPTNPILNGDIQTTQDGTILFNSNRFDIRVGKVSYKDTHPEDPQLYVNADALIKVRKNSTFGDSNSSSDAETDDYDISLLMQGSPNEPLINLTSQPPLAEHELISLLTLGFISSNTDDDDNVDQTQKVTNTSVQLGSALINKQISETAFSKAVQDSLGVEFGFSSSFDTDNDDYVHKLYIKKHWSPKFSTSASRSTGKDREVNVEAEYKLNRNLSVIGTWDNKEDTTTNSTSSDNNANDYFGLDLEYKLEFE